MDYSRYEKLRALVRGSFSSETQRLVDEALAYADERLAGMTRYDGSPLLGHGAGVACIVISEIGLGRNSTLSSILHDVVRIAHKQQTQEEFLALMSDLRARFGEQVAGITMGLCNISELKLKVANEQAGNFRDLIVSYSEDPRVILIKLADRLEVMRSLDIFPREKWRKKSWESMNLYAQIAHKLGLYGLESELEDIALKYLEPKDYEHIVAKLEESADERRAFIARFIVPIEERLQKLGIRYHIKSRTKSIFSIWNKMQKQRVPFEGVYDIFAIRIIIDCPLEDEKRLCWTVYSIVTDFYTPNPNRMRDWISIPKSNGYESLHTTVSAEGRWVEVQIRTERMDAVAERGIAAHWRYKGVGQGAATSEQWLSRLRELMEDTPHALAQRFDAKPATGEIFVFTPNGDLRKLPEGATLLDFAFDIHTNLGATCSGGKVNNRAVSIREVLHNGHRRDSHPEEPDAQGRLALGGGHLEGAQQNQVLPARGAGQACPHGTRGARTQAQELEIPAHDGRGGGLPGQILQGADRHRGLRPPCDAEGRPGLHQGDSHAPHLGCGRGGAARRGGRGRACEGRSARGGPRTEQRCADY